MRSILLLTCCALCLVSCQNNQSKIPVVGEIDSAAIARDTAMQLGLESSYEYHKTLAVNENLVYDVVAYGGSASKGEFAILKRSTDNKADTVVKEARNGIIADAFLADSNKNKQPEVYIVIQNPAQAADKKVLRYEMKEK